MGKRQILARNASREIFSQTCNCFRGSTDASPKVMPFRPFFHGILKLYHIGAYDRVTSAYYPSGRGILLHFRVYLLDSDIPPRNLEFRPHSRYVSFASFNSPGHFDFI
jgi:hypothetical protein